MLSCVEWLGRGPKCQSGHLRDTVIARHRHCERSEAIQLSFLPRDGLLRCARNDGRIQIRILAACFARGLACSFGPLVSEGAGNAGRPMRPIAACAEIVELRTRVVRSHRKTPGIPRAMVLTASFALSPATGLFCHRHQRKLLPANLTPASGRQDHTTSPSASGAVVYSTIRVHRIPPLRS